MNKRISSMGKGEPSRTFIPIWEMIWEYYLVNQISNSIAHVIELDLGLLLRVELRVSSPPPGKPCVLLRK